MKGAGLVLQHVRNGEVLRGDEMSDADWIMWKVTNRQERFPDAKKVQVMRGILRLCAREHIALRHGTVKHARDVIRHLEKAR